MQKLFFKNFLWWLCFFCAIQFVSQEKIINSGWQFQLDKDKQWQTVNLPHTWNLEDAFDDDFGYYRGVGTYKKQLFFTKKDANLIHYIHFNAAYQDTDVYVNGLFVGNHKGGFTAFNFNISAYLKFGTYNLIEVKVNSSHNDNIPPLDADFTFYGGIYRDVTLISKPKQHISLDDFASDGFYIDFPDISEEKTTIKVSVLLSNFSKKYSKAKLKITLFNAEGEQVSNLENNTLLKSNSTSEKFVNIQHILKPILWSPSNPYLYKINISLVSENDILLDERTQKIAFRFFNVDAKKGFFLNGKPLKLIGVNRHQDFEGYGNSVPLELHKKDIYLIKNMGANMLRTAHYPQDRAIYKLCDELGILIWSEIPVVNLVTDSDAFFKNSLTMQEEHIKQYYNHPSLAMIGYMNEIFIKLIFDRKIPEENKENLKKISVKLAKELEQLTRKLAPNHITVMAGHLNDIYNETKIADIPMLFGWNLYFGWYDKNIEDLGPFLDNQHKKFPNRALFLSEYGPGADVRIFTQSPKKFDFSLNYQSTLHQSYYQQIIDRSYMAGMTAWNFADFGSEFRGDAIPHINQKGLVQYNRVPKDIYFWYKAVLDKKNPFVYIASSFLKEIKIIGETSYPIEIFTNQKKVTVFLNDQKFAEENRVTNGVVRLFMPFKNGENKIKVVADNILEEKTIKVATVKKLDFKNYSKFGINIGAHFYFHDEKFQTTFVPDQAYKKGLFGYKDGYAYGITDYKHQGLPHNIKNSNSEPLFQTLLEGCSNYKLDIPNGTYKVHLFFVEPNVKATENIYNLSTIETKNSKKEERIFSVFLNDIQLEKQLNLANEYPQKYGVESVSVLEVRDNKGLNIIFKPIKGKPVISGVLVEKLN
ncbi:glycoside hydrolase family 2 TIM barrel-domain containing protein [Polaribacter tangerinus]|uniref:glycoside hydrolase family 2 TIM barrel-domain containing protein n=1 Tax=Polaribacter tangerinus TaxID=1920034 RepID=UPI000B4A6E4C|nr:glycoside hydrolase family 2 TIM barrel-domain containing protein [Polaribacter tangerinus]